MSRLHIPQLPARALAVTSFVTLMLMLASSPAAAQYQLTNLSSNQVCLKWATYGQRAKLSRGCGNPPRLVERRPLNQMLSRGDRRTIFLKCVHEAPAPAWYWVSDNISGWSTLYNGAGVAQGLRVLIPTAGGGPDSPTGSNGPGSPTGIVWSASTTGEFQVEGWPSIFLFATLDGTISGWTFKSNANQALVAVDTSTQHDPSDVYGSGCHGQGVRKTSCTLPTSRTIRWTYTTEISAW